MALGLVNESAPASGGRIDRMKARLPGRKGGPDETAVSPPTLASFDHATGFSLRSEGLRPKTTLEKDGTRREIERPALTAELVGNLTDHLREDLDRMIGMKKELAKELGSEEKGDAEFHRLIDSPRNRKYGKLYEELAQEKKGTGGRSVEINNDAIQEFMSTDKGIATMAEITKRELQEQSFAAAVYLHMNLPEDGPREIRPDEASVTLSRGGKLYESIRGKRMQEPRKRVNGREDPNALDPDTRGQVIRSSLALGTIAGGAAFGPVGMLAGGAVFSAVGLEVLDRARSGESIEISKCLDAAKVAASDPDARKWARHFYKLDVNDYENVGGNVQLKADIKSGRVLARTRIDAATLRDNLVGMAKDVLDYQEQTGIRPELRTPMDTSWILEGTGQPPQHGTGLELRVLKRMQGQVLDTAGRPSAIESSPGSDDWIANPAFDPTNVDVVGNFARYDKLWDEELQKDIDEVFQNIVDGKKDYEQKLFGEIGVKKAKYGKEGTLSKDKKAKIEKELADDGVLVKDNALLDEVTTVLDTFEAGARAVEAKDQEIQRLVNRVTVGGGAVDAAKLRKLIVGVTQPHQIGAVPDVFEVDGAVMRSLQMRSNDLDTLVASEMTNWRSRNKEPKEPTPLQSGASKEAIAGFSSAQKAYYENLKNYQDREEAYRLKVWERPTIKSASNKIETDRLMLESLLTELKTKEDAVKDEKVKLLSRENNEVRTKTESEFKDAQRARSEIIGWNGTGGVDLSEAALQGQTLDELTKRINEAHEADPKVGWPEEANKEQANRERLLNAVIESRIVTTPDFTAAIDPKIWGLSEFDLLVMERSDIKNLLTRRQANPPPGTSLPTMPGDPEINAIMATAHTRLADRRRVAEELKSANETRVNQLNNELARITEKGVLSPELDIIEKYMSRYGEIRSEISSSDLDMDELLTTDKVDRTNPDDANEYASFEDGESKAWVNVMQIMLDHRHDEDTEFKGKKGPEAAFDKNQTVISKEEFTRQLIKKFGLSVAPPGATGGPSEFDQAVTQLSSMNISKRDMARFLTHDIIYKVLGPKVQTL